jgi:hypothetical protein
MVSKISVVMLLALLAAAPLGAQEPTPPVEPTSPPRAGALAEREGVVGVGMQFTWPTYGVSGMFDFHDDWSIQGVIGTAGFGLSLTARGIHRLAPQELYRPYAYAEMGSWSNYREWGTVPNFGLGGGVEVDMRDFVDDAPPVYLSFELGLNVAVYRDAELGSGTYARFQFGPAAHYRF